MRKIVLTFIVFVLICGSASYSSDSPPSQPDKAVPATSAVTPPVDDPATSITVPDIDCAALGGKEHCTAAYLMDSEINLHSAVQFAVWLEAASRAGVKNAVIDIESGGGSLELGYSIIKAIEYSDMNVVCIADVKTASMAFAILESCNKRYMVKRAFLMTHQPFVSAETKPLVEDENTRLLTLATIGAYNEYIAGKLHMNYDEYSNRVKNGKMWFMDWKTALKYHAIDKVVPSVNEVIASLRLGETLY